MSSAVYLATGKVRHVGIFVPVEYDPVRRWLYGSYRPACAAVTDPGRWLEIDLWSASNPDRYIPSVARRLRAAMRRPLCKRCVAVIADAHALTEQTP